MAHIINTTKVGNCEIRHIERNNVLNGESFRGNEEFQVILNDKPIFHGKWYQDALDFIHDEPKCMKK